MNRANDHASTVPARQWHFQHVASMPGKWLHMRRRSRIFSVVLAFHAVIFSEIPEYHQNVSDFHSPGANVYEEMSPKND